MTTHEQRLAERTRHQQGFWIARLREHPDVDSAVYKSTNYIDVFREQRRFDEAQVSTAIVATILIALGWPTWHEELLAYRATMKP